MINEKNLFEVFFTTKWRLSAIQYWFCKMIIEIPITIRRLFFTDMNWFAWTNVIILLIIWIIRMITDICLTIQRAHDLWWSWWKLVLCLIPIYNIYIGLCLLFKGWIDGRNEYWEETEATIAFIVVTIIMAVSTVIFCISLFDDYKNFTEIDENYSTRESDNPEVLELSIYNSDFISEINDKFHDLLEKELWCTNCSPYTLIKNHEKLKKVYKEYENFVLELSKDSKYAKKE